MNRNYPPISLSAMGWSYRYVYTKKCLLYSETSKTLFCLFRSPKARTSMILVRRDAECQGDADEHDYKPYNNKLTQSMHNESGHIWTHLQTCWSQVLGPCCAPLGSFGPILGPYWDRIGPILGNLGLYWTHMGPYGRERARERERERERYGF